LSLSNWIYIGFLLVMAYLLFVPIAKKNDHLKKEMQQIKTTMIEKCRKGLKDVDRYNCYQGLTQVQYEDIFVKLAEFLEGIAKNDDIRQLESLNEQVDYQIKRLQSLKNIESSIKEYISSINILLAQDAGDDELLKKQKQVLEQSLLVDIVEGYEILNKYKEKPKKRTVAS
jgi:hypothetical protein